MKKYALAIGLLSSAKLFAEPIEVTRVLKDTTTQIALQLDANSVFCTERGYGSVQLKISVPDLDWLAHFDHRVVGERLPCITGGECSDVLKPGTIIDPTDPIVVAPVRVVLSEHVVIDRDAKTCSRTLLENIYSTIRGRKFTHVRTSNHEPVAFAKCEKLFP